MGDIAQLLEGLEEGTPVRLVHANEKVVRFTVFLGTRPKGYEFAWRNTDPHSRETMPLESLVIPVDMCTNAGKERGIFEVSYKGHYLCGVFGNDRHLRSYEQMLERAGY